MVPEEGVEPTHPFGYGILSPARLPVPPLRLELHRISGSGFRFRVPGLVLLGSGVLSLENLESNKTKLGTRNPEPVTIFKVR